MLKVGDKVYIEKDLRKDEAMEVWFRFNKQQPPCAGTAGEIVSIDEDRGVAEVKTFINSDNPCFYIGLKFLVSAL